MLYKDFLYIKSQLVNKKTAQIVIDDQAISFVASSKKRNRLKITTTVFSGDGSLPKSVRSCVSSSGKLRWQQGGAHIQLDPETQSVLLIEEVEIEENKYLPFKEALNDFTLAAKEWQEILQNIAEQNSSFVSLSYRF
jgi:hypothetical protein